MVWLCAAQWRHCIESFLKIITLGAGGVGLGVCTCVCGSKSQTSSCVMYCRVLLLGSMLAVDGGVHSVFGCAAGQHNFIEFSNLLGCARPCVAVRFRVAYVCVGVRMCAYVCGVLEFWVGGVFRNV